MGCWLVFRGFLKGLIPKVIHSLQFLYKRQRIVRNFVVDLVIVCFQGDFGAKANPAIAREIL